MTRQKTIDLFRALASKVSGSKYEQLQEYKKFLELGATVKTPFKFLFTKTTLVEIVLNCSFVKLAPLFFLYATRTELPTTYDKDMIDRCRVSRLVTSSLNNPFAASAFFKPH